MQSEQAPTPGQRADIIALAVGQGSFTGLLGDGRKPVVVRPQTSVWDIAQGETVTLSIRRTWTFGGTRFISGAIEAVRLDVASWGLPPLSLAPAGDWDPRESFAPENLGRAKDPAARCLRSVLKAGVRPAFEMEQVLPGSDPGDPDLDPIIEAMDAWHGGDPDRAQELLQGCLRQDLRCIDAHVHLGHMQFRDGHTEWGAERARKHYTVGAAVGDAALGPGFNGVLSWGYVDNRPFLRSLHGLGLAAWRLGDQDAARRVMERLLWLDPEDHIGARFCLPPICAGRPYSPE